MTAFGTSYIGNLRNTVSVLLDTIRDIPADDLNSWKPAAVREGGLEMNTFSAIAIHVVSAGEFMTLHAVGGEPSTRVRKAEFRATGNFIDIEDRYQRWLDAVETLVAELTDEDLARKLDEERYASRDWTVADVLLHALDHTALHLGHIQIQRQTWEFERSR